MEYSPSLRFSLKLHPCLRSQIFASYCARETRCSHSACTRRTSITCKRGSANCTRDSSSRENRLLVELLRRGNGKHHEKHQNNQLRHLKRRLGLRRSQRFQGRNLIIELRDQDEHIQVEGNHGGDHVGPPPAAGKVTPVARKHRHR